VPHPAPTFYKSKRRPSNLDAIILPGKVGVLQ
jgi:hypothetical protein